MIDVGSLVRSPKNDMGIGKVVEVSHPDAIVEYFCSVKNRIRKTVPLSLLQEARLQRQTRCYLWSTSQERWIIGRVYDWDEDKLEYEIDLPDSQSLQAVEAELYVRCNIPIADPIDILAVKGQETPYFHDRRLAFVQSAIEQRAVSRGMTGLISANIDLYPHQVEVVRRVLEDPIVRYLLADEAGLGKTVEAGTILRQFLLDDANGRAVVIVPKYLLEQWRQELENKFYLSHFADRVQLVSLSEINQISRNANLDFLIVDEAQELAAMANSSDRNQQQSFELCQKLAHKSKNLLLLSATPVIGREQDFLTMLHLLDPTTYRVDDLQSFKAQVQNRQEIGRTLLDFRETTQPAVLQTKLAQLRTLFAKDDYLIALAKELEKSLKTKETEEKSRLIRTIRTHVRDTYRLHRRILRNRRDAVEDVIFDRDTVPKAEYDLNDEQWSEIQTVLDKWRAAAPKSSEYQRIFLLFFRASGTWLNVLERVIKARLQKKSSPELDREFGQSDTAILTRTALFSEERELLETLLNTVSKVEEGFDRLGLLRIAILRFLAVALKVPREYHSNPRDLLSRIQQQIKRPIPGERFPKIVIFTSFTTTCQEIAENLAKIFGKKAIASHDMTKSADDVEANLHRFKTEPHCFVLVCDRSAETGVNLQFIDWLVHFDLPWFPNQLEQRLSRVDRIGSKMGVQFCLFAGPDMPDSPHEAWFQVLKNGFDIFNKSIASLQFYAETKLITLEEKLFTEGAKGLSSELESIKTEIEQEKIKIDEQYALDEIDILDDSASQYFESLDNCDARHKEMQRAAEGWLCQALHFKQVEHPSISGLVRYQPTQKTLIPSKDLTTQLVPYCQQYGSYNRRIAHQNTDVVLYRTGEGLIDALGAYVRWDDRGQAFAMWRHDESWDAAEGKEWFGFQFNYSIQTDVQPAAQVLQAQNIENYNLKALQRRADALFLPIFETVYVDARSEQMSLVEDAEVLAILQRGYKGKGGPNRDYNLSKNRTSLIDNFVDSLDWDDFCQKGRVVSEELLRGREAFVEMCNNSATSAAIQLKNRVNQLQLRLNRLSKSEQLLESVLADEISTESLLSQAVLAGIRHPHLTLESVGFIVISGRAPVKSEDEG
ncbi:MAG: DEAD/DEAH box helicase [Microcoleus sp. PH2017_01_SCD_O_A]|uniref:protein DpdE n=1 Tax=unclassified Microcoleus TaxID=2642155 RepID=UPI001DE0FA85|nr:MULTISPECIES: protein DpdE [unclassified Microcoleus]MCC3428229.1 DEAD/DEAH box helicase [Microcoleus sp. PH2017_01_SCD_O_A]MCC3474638.1 DEAD/DEAH box helicase [Microcoleus sp. PH2017_13_LAR_U_A]MCC3487138.1 DEAD/DEAH box helicase [Microcoleus sp. PH2017_14_LAR_D_A]MCC3496623.1 DEAD/DEAH box helicase [Microcoleus sp. PH2017_15_JOR_U_A]MCC3518618.1 DEAD/DEAH box helicase [Microcoleus sp. PH2017_18_LLB_O_A]